MKVTNGFRFGASMIALGLATSLSGVAAAQAAGWPFAGVYSPAEVLEADHLHQRGFWTECDDPTIGPVLLPGPPYRHAERLSAPLSKALPAVLAPVAVAVAESDRRAPLSLDLPLHDERRYGDTLIRIHGS